MTSEQLLCQALGLYNLQQPEPEFIRHNENMTYRINCADKTYVLRIHKPVEGFSTGIFNMNHRRAELVYSELDIIYALKNGTDLPMQTPVCGINGGLVQSLSDNTPVTLLEWVEGETVENAGTTPEILKYSGKLMAEMHAFFLQKSELSKRYIRYDYDQTILPRIAERIESAARAEILTTEQMRTVLKALDEICRRFDELDSIQEKHLVHADLGKSNVIIAPDGRLTPIDFSLCGYSHFYMDIGGIFGLDCNDEGRKHIIEGYKSVRNCVINPRYIEPYLALSVLLFIAGQYERAKDWAWFPGHMERWRRDIFEPLADKASFILV